MNNPGRLQRIKRELAQLASDPPPGLVLVSSAAATTTTTTTTGDADEASKENDRRLKSESVNFDVKMTPPHESIYAGGSFVLEVALTTNYPFEAPLVRFKTRIYHPNIDGGGRICLDSLKLPPQGGWRPSLNVSQVLSQIMILLSEPGLGDPLMPDIAELYKNDREEYARVAKEWVRLYASSGSMTSSSAETSSSLPDSKRAKLS